ncbi:MAG: hypothetical protein JW940_07880 [Polyangiaceae bacterium]|nr:hypothetical protein [Polyangiaceae bacterium]
MTSNLERSLRYIKPLVFGVCAALAGACGGGSRDSHPLEFEFQIEGGAEVTASTDLQLQVTPLTGAPTKMQIWEDKEGDTHWDPYRSETDFDLTDEEGTHRVWMRLQGKGVTSERRSETIVLDTAPPAIAFLSHADGQVLRPGGITVELKVTEKNDVAEVSILEDGKPRSVSRKSDGTYTATATIGEGENRLEAVAIDQAGNEGQASVMLEGHGPSPEVSLAQPKNGSYHASNVVEVRGTADATASEVRLVVNDEPTAWFDVDDRSFSWMAELEEGPNALRAEALGKEGFVGSSGAVSVVVDTTPPAKTSIEIADGADSIETTTVDLRLHAEDDTPLEMAIYNVGDDDDPVWRPYDPLVTDWELDSPKDEGRKRVRVRFRDAAGNEAEPAEAEVLADLQGPEIALESPADGLVTEASSVLVAGTVSDVETVTLSLSVNGSSRNLPLDAGAFSVDAALRDGKNTLALTAVDAFGRVSLLGPISVTVAGPAPGLTIASPLDGTVTGLSTLPLSGTVQEGDLAEVQLSVDGMVHATVPVTDGSFAGKVPLVAGDNILRASGTDTDGRTGLSAPVTVYRDTVAPEDVSVAINGGATTVSSLDVVLALTAEDRSNLEMMVSNSSDFAGATWEPFADTKSWTLEDDGTGRLTVAVRVRDVWGNGPTSADATVTLDTRPPTITSVSHDASGSLGMGQTIHFTLEADEPDGQAWVNLGDVHPDIRLYDDGTHGDAVAGDGVFERDYTVCFGDQPGGQVMGGYLDPAGNPAVEVAAPGLVSIAIEPVAFEVNIEILEICTTSLDDLTYDDAYYFRDSVRAPESGYRSAYSDSCVTRDDFGPDAFWTFTATASEATVVVVEGWDYDSLSADDSLGAATATVALASPDYDFAQHVAASGNSGYFEFNYTKTVVPYLTSPTHPDPDVGYAESNVALSWVAPPVDVGVAGFAYALDEDPPEAVMTTESSVTLEDVPPGTHEFAVHARDNLGNWSPVATRKFIVTE